MPPSRKEKQKIIFRHVIQVLLNVRENSVLYAALLQRQCDTNFDNLLNMEETEIDSLECTHNGRTFQVGPDEKTCLKEFKAFHLNTFAKMNIEPDWLQVTEDMYGDFLMHGGYYPGINLSHSPDSPERPITEDTTAEKKIADVYKPSRATQSHSAKKKAMDARKPSFATQSRPTKHNPDAYPILEDESKGNHWIKRFRAIAANQDLSNVLDPAYRPRGPHATRQFNEDQDFLFDVLCTKVTLPQGQAIVRRYERGRDAQGALEAIVNYFIALERDLLDDICTVQLIDLPANVTLTEHLSVWVELVYKYSGNVLDPHGGMDDRDKKNYLQRFVKGSELEGVKVSKAYDDYVQDIFCAAMST